MLADIAGVLIVLSVAILIAHARQSGFSSTQIQVLIILSSYSITYAQTKVSIRRS